MKIYDITAPIFNGMPVYKNKPEKQPEINTNTNGHVTESRISMDVHTGTHVDAPLHMINDGETIETIDIQQLVRPVKVLDLTSVEEKITKKDIENYDIQENDFLLFKTKNSWDTEFNFEFIYVAEDAASYLKEKKVAGTGIDSLGIERAQEGHPTHRTLMGSRIIIMEGLQLKDIEEGSYFMVAAPLKIEGTDASPARVILMDELIG
ncbi:cyclase family protein [Rossellomorea vietnamensis]|uniref:Kynurenine formamidase n=2 Tax=Rossellomorea TaxID=2837508 RepID=A0A5D4KHK5_9BACI|nr:MULTISPECIES: cyclase family protein [Rossellomorea]TYR76359.1 cyclase family protein [Rossellomorea vietnamensis]TYS76300.1 cyclase family protein [Rossellomorea aquimaris]